MGKRILQSKKPKRPAHVRHPRHKMLRDLLIVAVSFAGAYYLAQFGALNFLIASHGNNILGSFIAGALFTSTFTIAPAAVVLADIAHVASPYTVALWGAFGSMLGDLVLFNFIKGNLAHDAEDILEHSPYKRFLSVFHLRFFRWLTPLVGALVIASPLPDEIGLAMMGFSRMRTAIFLPISFAMSYLGILFICFLAQSVS
ncbi:MAG TPA: hypothetical protein VHF05_02900 [Candidatus Paceibacterota bacterium]|jgi:hypothetical protein|nr:hypothetical protein [Candidatus Paceibacterota bacterium]